jgi:hypothetical protein
LSPREAERRSRVKRILLPEDVDMLLAFAEAIARALAEKHGELGIIHQEVEARLRAGIAAATFAIRRFIAVLSAARRSQVAMSYVGEARSMECPTLSLAASVHS